MWVSSFYLTASLFSLKLIDILKYFYCSPQYAVGCDEDRCLKWSQICNGVRDCADGTDESIELCAYSICPLNSFRCENGACINSNAFCNREIDCADGSDEIPDLCRKTVSTSIGTTINGEVSIDENNFVKHDVWSPNGCALTPQLGMQVTDLFSDFSYRSDAKLPLKTVVSLTCESGYESSGSNIQKCIDNSWTPDYFKCIPLCKQSAIERNIRYETQCMHDNDLTNCRDNSFIFDTKLLVTCAPGFKPANADTQLGRHICNETGLWFTEHANPKCEAICGIKSEHHPNIIPWTVSIFKRISSNEDIYDFKCFGTILSPYIVLTATSCLNDLFGQTGNHIYFTVAEGNHRFSFNHLEDHGYNLHNISKIHILRQ